MGIRQRNLEVRGRRASCDVAREHRLAVPIGESDAERQRAGSRFQQACIDAHALQIAPRRNVHSGKWRTASCFQIHRLPDAACWAVPLLAFELERVWRVVHA